METAADLMTRYVAFVASPQARSLPPVIQALLPHFFLDTIHSVHRRQRTDVAAGRRSNSVPHGFNLHGTYALIGYFYRASGGDVPMRDWARARSFSRRSIALA